MAITDVSKTNPKSINMDGKGTVVPYEEGVVKPREFWVNTDYTPEFETNPPWIIAKENQLPIDATTWIKVREVL